MSARKLVEQRLERLLGIMGNGGRIKETAMLHAFIAAIGK